MCNNAALARTEAQASGRSPARPSPLTVVDHMSRYLLACDGEVGQRLSNGEFVKQMVDAF
jgi:hypothetical protein